MKRTIGFLVLAFGLVSEMNSQQAVASLTEDFTAPFNPVNAGWIIQNNSVPSGTINWFQGNAISTFSAYNGGLTDYFAANYNSTSATSTAGTISNWLISPVVNLSNGARIEFATRTTNASTVFPDRMQVLVSPSNYTLPYGSATVGSFTLAFDVNSNLSNATTATQTGTTTSGYPQSWTVYSAVLSGITGTMSGRIAFRYFVTNAGAVGINGNYIGLDAVRYYEACDQPVITTSNSASGNICAGASVSLTAAGSGSSTVSSFTWSSGANSATAVVSPSATTVYTVRGATSGGCIGTSTISVGVDPTPVIRLADYTVCSGSAFTLTPLENTAASYTWANNSSTASGIAISPTATTVYTLNGVNSSTACPVSATSTITVGPQLSMDVMPSAATICAGQVVTVNLVSAASSQTWSTGSNATSFTASPATSTVYTVSGALGACTGTNAVSITVNANPTFAVTQSSVICSGSSFSASATGAASYEFQFLAFTSTANPVSFTTSPVTLSTSVQYSVVGSGSNGCTTTDVHTYTIIPGPAINVQSVKFADCIKSTMTVVATGANTYTWVSTPVNTTPSLTVPTGTVAAAIPFTVAGTSTTTGCTSTVAVSIQVSDCAGIESVSGTNLFRAYPNPFGDELRFAGVENGSIEIYNVLGEKVASAKTSETVNTQSFSKGIYIVKAFDASGREFRSAKLIKN